MSYTGTHPTSEISFVPEPANEAVSSKDRTPVLLAVIILSSLVYLAALLYYAKTRPVDGDEGYYSSAARLVWEGNTPYLDFFYPQAPLFPYLYSWIWGIHPHSLVAMRFLSAALGALAALLLGSWLLFMKKFSTIVVFATFAIVLLNPYWVSWNVTVKTHAIANLLMSVAMICLYAALHSGRARWLFVAGLALGACASVRGLYGPLVPLVLLWLLRRDSQKPYRSFHSSLTYLAGAICGMLPMIVTFAADPGAFVFDNVLYRHLMAPHVSLRHTLHLYVVLMLVPVTHPYFAAELLLAIAGIISFLKLRKRRVALYTPQDYLYFELALLMLLVYSGTALIPFPPWDQYYHSPLLPFVVLFIAEGVRATYRSGRKQVVLLAALAPIFFVGDLRREIAEYSPGKSFQLSSYRTVTQAIEANSRPDDIVLSFWPGYVFESGRRFFPGAEDHFAYSIAYKIDPQARARYHLLSKNEIIDLLFASAVDIVVSAPSPFILESSMSDSDLKTFRAALNSNYYVLSKIDDRVSIYKRRAPQMGSRVPLGAR